VPGEGKDVVILDHMSTGPETNVSGDIRVVRMSVSWYGSVGWRARRKYKDRLAGGDICRQSAGSRWDGLMPEFTAATSLDGGARIPTICIDVRLADQS